MKCEICGKEVNDSIEHFFSGYDFYVHYCEEHCPIEMDGTECLAEFHSKKNNGLQKKQTKD